MPKVIVAGCRDGFEEGQVWVALSHELVSDIPELEIVSGGARGVDTYGESWAYEANVDVKRFPADWNTHGKKAGFLRNVDMSRYADKLIAFWDGESKGTGHMIKVMADLKKPVTIYYRDDFVQTEQGDEEDDE